MTASAPFVEVAELLGPELRGLDFQILAGEDRLDRRILAPRVQKPGLAFAGYYDYVKPGRVQIVGASETAYLEELSNERRRERFEAITALDVPVFVVTKGLPPHTELAELCRERQIPLLASSALSSSVIQEIGHFLENLLVPSTRMHGVFLDVHGLGVLMIGDSGVGKSECALDLISRGHSLVADDVVTIRRYPGGNLVGFSEARQGHHMELRGLGIVNVRDLFGLAAVRERKPLDLVVELEPWEDEREYDRLGIDDPRYEILGATCPYIRMPVALGRNLSILVEIAARNQLLKMRGRHSAREFVRQLDERLRGRSSSEPAK